MAGIENLGMIRINRNRFEELVFGSAVSGVIIAGYTVAQALKPFRYGEFLPFMGYVKFAVVLSSIATGFMLGSDFASSLTYSQGNGFLRSPLKTLGNFATSYLFPINKNNFFTAELDPNTKFLMAWQMLEGLLVSCLTAYYVCGFVFSPIFFLRGYAGGEKVVEEAYKYAAYLVLTAVGIFKLYQFNYPRQEETPTQRYQIQLTILPPELRNRLEN